jgi:putative phosphoribosyl transferase
MGVPLFQNRTDAGRQLASQLHDYANREDVIVLGLPRGGVPVAYEVAQALNVPLDIFLVRKLGVPGHEELAMGAIASGGTIVLNREVLDLLPDAEGYVKAVAVREKVELDRRERAYRGSRPHPDLTNRIVILVDDGLATGASMRAAADALRAHDVARIVVAVPVAARETCAAIRKQVDETVCVATPELFYAVGMWYRDFSPTTDDEVRELLGQTNVASRPL